MKLLFCTVIAFLGLNSMAIENFDEEDVAKFLKADKVIQVHKQSLQSIAEKTVCKGVAANKPAKAYVVKIKDKSYLYMTTEKLVDLGGCAEL